MYWFAALSCPAKTGFGRKQANASEVAMAIENNSLIID
jgi:hypothetical protein